MAGEAEDRSQGSGVAGRSVTVVVMGVSGTGKTTLGQALAARLGWQMLEGDDLHPAVNVAKMRSGHPLDDDDRRPWLQSIAAWIGARESDGADSVVACSALKRSYRDLLRDGHPSVLFCHLTAPRAQLAERLARRQGHFMTATLLDSQLATLEPLEPDETGVTVPDNGDPDHVLAYCLTALAPLIALRREDHP